MQSQFYGNIVTMSAFENRIDLAVYETCQRIKPQFWSHALALLSFCSREEEKTWRTRVKKGSLINSPIIFYSLKFVLLAKDKLRKIRVFGLEFLNCRCHFFPVPDSPRDAILPWNVGRSHFLFVSMVVCVRPHSLFAAIATIPAIRRIRFVRNDFNTNTHTHKRIPFIIPFIQANIFHIIVYTIEMLLQLAVCTPVAICISLFSLCARLTA